MSPRVFSSFYMNVSKGYFLSSLLFSFYILSPVQLFYSHLLWWFHNLCFLSWSILTTRTQSPTWNDLWLGAHNKENNWITYCHRRCCTLCRKTHQGRKSEVLNIQVLDGWCSLVSSCPSWKQHVLRKFIFTLTLPKLPPHAQARNWNCILDYFFFLMST